MKLRRILVRGLPAALALALGLAACRPDEPKLELALNWKPEPEFGGLFEAERIGAFAKRGLALERTGGPGAPVVQMVTARQVAFGIASADEVVLARDRGSDVVAVFATYQTCPQGLMTHAARGIAFARRSTSATGTPAPCGRSAPASASISCSSAATTSSSSRVASARFGET